MPRPQNAQNEPSEATSGPFQLQVSESGAGALLLSWVKALSFESKGMGLLHFMRKVMGLSLFRPRALGKIVFSRSV